MKGKKDEDRLGFIRGEFLLRSKEGKELLRTKEFKKSLSEKIGGTGKHWKLFVSGSPIFIQFKRGVFLRFDNFLGGTVYEVTKRKHIHKRLLIHAVNRRDKTIILKIRLGRRLTPAVNDFKTLLGMIEKEAEQLKVDLKRPKPHLDELELALRVYDLRQKQIQENKKSWRNLALHVFPGEDSDNAIRKVRHNHATAVKMINGEWKRLL